MPMGTARETSLQKRVYETLMKSAGIPMHMNDIAIAVSASDRVSSVQSALTRMNDNPDYPVYRVGKGTYVFRPVPGMAINPTAAYPPEVTPHKAEKDWSKVEFPVEVRHMDAVSPYPEELLKSNAAYGKAEVFEFVGTVGDKMLIRNTVGEMFIAIPLSQFVD
jgi:hypothetical protein